MSTAARMLHRQRMGDFWDVVTLKPVRDVAGDAADFVGLTDLVNGPLRDFANTAVGKVVLRAISTTFYGSLVPFLGPQMASVAFAVPGLFRGQDFDAAWFDEVKWRAEQTAEILGGDAAEIFAAQLSETLKNLSNDIGVGNPVEWSLKQLEDQYDIREDVAAFSKSIWNGLELPKRDDFELTTGRAKTGIERVIGAGISPEMIARQNVTGGYTARTALEQASDGLSASTMFSSSAWNDHFDVPGTAPAPMPVSVVRSPAQSPNRSSGDMILAGTIVAAAGALAWFYWPRGRRAR